MRRMLFISLPALEEPFMVVTWKEVPGHSRLLLFKNARLSSGSVLTFSGSFDLFFLSLSLRACCTCPAVVYRAVQQQIMGT